MNNVNGMVFSIEETFFTSDKNTASFIKKDEKEGKMCF